MVDVTTRFRALADKLEPEEYNYEHFRTTHLINDLRRTLAVRGVHPGQPAPDFDLPLAEGGSVRLHDLRGKPVLLRFGSFT